MIKFRLVAALAVALLLLSAFSQQLWLLEIGSFVSQPPKAADCTRVVTREPKNPPPMIPTTHATSPGDCVAKKLVYVDDVIIVDDDVSNSNTLLSSSNNSTLSSLLLQKKIPPYIHQTSKSRCMAPQFVELVDKWKQFEGYSYFFWDDEAMMNLLRSDFPEFPNLEVMVDHCLPTGTLRADLWRYLVLYTYGGIYADIDTAPVTFHPTSMITTDDEAWFVVENWGLLSQYFMAASPRHPIMYYTIQRILAQVYEETDTVKISAPGITGPHALHRGYESFLQTPRKKWCASHQSKTVRPCVTNGTYVGVDGHTVTVAGDPKHANDIVHRQAINGHVKKKMYRVMDMVHFDEQRRGEGSGISCFDALRKLA